MNHELGIKNQGLVLGIRTDTADSTVILSEVEGSILDQKTWTSGRKLSEQLLGELEELITSNNKTWNDISGVVVFEGPGSFTGLRIGITVANTIAYAQKIKVAAAGGDDWLAEGTGKLASIDVGQIAMPEYGGEAHITKPKK